MRRPSRGREAWACLATALSLRPTAISAVCLGEQLPRKHQQKVVHALIVGPQQAAAFPLEVLNVPRDRCQQHGVGVCIVLRTALIEANPAGGRQ